jgi:hypothetical protein
MTPKELERIYNESAVVGHLEGIEAVYLTVYFEGRGVNIFPEKGEGIIQSLTAPARFVKISAPDLR